MLHNILRYARKKLLSLVKSLLPLLISIKEFEFEYVAGNNKS